MEVIKMVFFFKQKTAYEMCGRDWSSDVCSSDLGIERGSRGRREGRGLRERNIGERIERERGIDGRGSGARITSK